MARRVADLLAMQSQNAPSDLFIKNDYITDPADVSKWTRKASHSMNACACGIEYMFSNMSLAE